VTHPFSTRQIPFYLTASGPCPYLKGKQERKLFTRLDPSDGPGLNDALTHAGFRRSQGVLYRPACEMCDACHSARIPVRDFDWTRSFRRVLKRNDHLTREEKPAEATAEQYALLTRYLDSRHGDGDMAGMSYGEFVLMVEDGAQRTDIVEYRDDAGQLRAAALVDRLRDGPSLLYSFFEPDDTGRSPGTFMVLDAVRWSAAGGFSNVYLGYWVPGSRKMDYKSRFRPLEVLTSVGWQSLETMFDDTGLEPGADEGED
jgi:arginine-tRNA-protein transferase